MVGNMPVACGYCDPCRINRRRLWSHRMILESFGHPASCFLTLTYNDDNLPQDGSLKPDDLQLFIKRLRSRLVYKFRYYAVGEYGDDNGRPHFHGAIFGLGSCVGGLSVKGECQCANCSVVRETWGLVS